MHNSTRAFLAPIHPNKSVVPQPAVRICSCRCAYHYHSIVHRAASSWSCSSLTTLLSATKHTHTHRERERATTKVNLSTMSTTEDNVTVSHATGAGTKSFSEELRDEAGDQWTRVVEHRFATELATGTIDRKGESRQFLFCVCVCVCVYSIKTMKSHRNGAMLLVPYLVVRPDQSVVSIRYTLSPVVLLFAGPPPSLLCYYIHL